jgi:hypothetical protein
VRSFDEIAAELNALTPKKIVAHLRRLPPHDFTIVTLGPKPLRMPAEGNGRAASNGATKKQKTAKSK